MEVFPMLHVLTRENKSNHPELMDQMFRLRYRVLYEIMGWKECYAADGLERDESDHEDTVYFIATHPDIPGVAGCMRMAPSTTLNLSSCHFSNLFQYAPVPYDPYIYDGSRIVVDPATRALGKPNPVTTELYFAWFETIAALGLSGCTAVLETKYFTASVARGWNMIPMGPAVTVGADEIVPIKLSVSQQTLAGLHKLRGTNAIAISDDGINALTTFHRNYLQRFNAARVAA
jgi:N-acyl-L-homoserine lactone synthetase